MQLRLPVISDSKSETDPVCRKINANVTNERMARIFQNSLAKFAAFAYFALKTFSEQSARTRASEML